MKTGELFKDYFRSVMKTTNDMSDCREKMTDVKSIEKILSSLRENFNFFVCSFEEFEDIDILTIDDLKSSLLIHKQKLKEKQSEEQVMQVKHGPCNGRERGISNFQKGISIYVRGRQKISRRYITGIRNIICKQKC